MNRILIQPLLLLVLLVATSGVLAGNQDPAQGIVIKEVTVVGSTVFDEGDLQAAINPPIGETIYIEDVLEMVDAITSLYVDAGYITSGAVLPDQDVSGGRIVLNVVEGQLAGVNVVSTSTPLLSPLSASDAATCCCNADVTAGKAWRNTSRCNAYKGLTTGG